MLSSPPPKQSTASKQTPTRTAHMDTMLTVMVYRASPAARRMLGRVKLDGYTHRETMWNHTMMSSAMACASGERVNRDSANRLAKKTAERFITHAPK